MNRQLIEFAKLDRELRANLEGVESGKIDRDLNIVLTAKAIRVSIRKNHHAVKSFVDSTSSCFNLRSSPRDHFREYHNMRKERGIYSQGHDL